jgi:hypothetical protein
MIIYNPPQIKDTNWQTSDYLALFALIVAVLALVFSVVIIYLGKQVELKVIKFEKVCLENVKLYFKKTDIIFDQTTSNNLPASNFLNDFTEMSTGFTLLSSYLLKFYPRINVSEIEKILETFTDNLYNNQTQPITAFQSDYEWTKTEVLVKLYDFAIKKEIGLKFKLFRK